MVRNQQLQLLLKIVLEQARLGDGRGKDARPIDMTKGQATINRRVARGCDPHLRVKSPIAGAAIS